jgi:hypothetical protein
MSVKGGEKIQEPPENRAKPGKAAQNSRKEAGRNNRDGTEKMQQTAGKKAGHRGATDCDHHGQ